MDEYKNINNFKIEQATNFPFRFALNQVIGIWNDVSHLFILLRFFAFFLNDKTNLSFLIPHLTYNLI